MRLFVPLCGWLIAGCASVAPTEPWYQRALNLEVESVDIEVEGETRTMRYGMVGAGRCKAPGEVQPCPVLVVLPGGAQNENLMRETMRPWGSDLEQRGWLVLSPVALDRDRTFYGEQESGLVQWLDEVLHRHRIHQRPALLGVSNGGISAFRLIEQRPHAFRSVLVAPGYGPATDVRRFDGDVITLLVGERDPWRPVVEDSALDLKAQSVPVRVHVVPEAGHNLIDYLSTHRLLDFVAVDE